MIVAFLFSRAFAVAILSVSSLLWGGWADAEDTGPKRPLTALITDWNQVLDQTDKSLARSDVADDKLLELRQDLLALRLDVTARAAEASPQIQVLAEELQTLGKPPAEGAPPESAAVSSKRKTIGDRLAAMEGAVKESDLILSRTNRLLSDINARQRQRFTERILTRGPSPLFPAVWVKAWREIGDDFGSVRQSVARWIDSDEFTQRSPTLARDLSLGVGAAFILVWPLRLWLLRRFGYVAVEREPTHGQRFRVALFSGFIRLLLPTAATVAVYLAARNSDFLPDPAQLLADTLLEALVFLYVVAAFCNSALAPFESEWRLVDINDNAARIISRVVTAIALVFACDLVLDRLRDLFEASVELTLVHKFISGLAISSLLLILLQSRIWLAADETAVDPARGWRRLRFLLRVLVLGIPLSAMFGYVALSRMAATQLVLTAGLYVAVVVIRQVGGEAIAQAFSRESQLGMRIRETLNLSDDGAEMLEFWISETLGVLVIVAGILALLVLWGAGGDDLAAWLQTAFFGFKVGNITVSLADILLGLLLFAALLAVTRLFQHWLEHRIFPRTRLNVGLRHSIRSAAGYFGFTLAAAVAVSTAGIDLSNVAMIAGALSVGIGFGLQNIVNNFVSGLILLVERPIKVGDWVVVGEHQGYVRKISVRATEISTFDRASVFIPNSSLISGPVMNLTYADKVGRVVLHLGLPHGTESSLVRDLLLGIAEQQPDVSNTPPPAVFHAGYADSLLNLELVVFVRDVDKVKRVSSDLWFAVEDAFRREGISIPLGQKDFRVIIDSGQLTMLAAQSASIRSPAATPDPPAGLRNG